MYTLEELSTLLQECLERLQCLESAVMELDDEIQEIRESIDLETNELEDYTDCEDNDLC